MISKQNAVDLVIIAAIVGLDVWTFSFGFALGVVCASISILLVAAAFSFQIRETIAHKRKLRRMKWESWLTAIEDRDVRGDIDFGDPVAAHFLREKFEGGCTPYEAISEWRHRKAGWTAFSDGKTQSQDR